MASIRSKLLELIQRLTDQKGNLRRLVDRYANAQQHMAEAGGRREKRHWMEAPEPPRALYRKYNLERTDVNHHSVFILSPKNKTPKYHILYLHGGAFISSFYKQHWKFFGWLIDELECCITAPDYPLAPQYTYKDASAMLITVYKELLEKIYPDHLILMGDSAGGSLVLALAQRLCEESLPQPKHIILLSPCLDFTMTNPEIAAFEKKDTLLDVQSIIKSGKLYAGDDDPSNHLISPINGSIQSLGHISLFAGTHEVLIADCRKLKARAEAEGIPLDYYEYEGMMHIWVLLSLPESREARKQIREIIER